MAQPLEHVEYLSKEIGARPAGTEEEQNAALYIADQLQKEANFHAEIEEFTSSSNFPFVQAICCAVIVVVTVLAMFVPVLVIPAFILAAIAAAVYALEALDRPIVTRALARGASQNVVAKYQPNPDTGNSRRGGRSRKIVLVAHYDSGKVTPGLVQRVESFGLPLGLVCAVATIVAAVLLLLRIFIGSVGGPVAVIFNIITIIALLVLLLPIVKAVLVHLAPYNEGANNNASGVAAVMEVARRISHGSVSEADLADEAEGVAIHGEAAAIANGLVPEGAEIRYEAERLTPPEMEPLDDEERLLSAKAAIAALTGKPVERRVYGSVASHLVNSRAMGASEMPLDQADQPVAEPAEVSAEVSPSVAAAPAASAEPVSAAQDEPQVDEPVDTGFDNAPSWFVAAQQKAKKPTGQTGSIQRSRYTEAIEAAEREQAAREQARLEEERARQEEERRAREQAARDAIAAAAEVPAPAQPELAPEPAPEPELAPEPEPAEAPQFVDVEPIEPAESAFQPVDATQPQPPLPNQTVAVAPINMAELAAELEAEQAGDTAPAVEEEPVAEPRRRIASLPTIGGQEPQAKTDNPAPSRSGMFRKLRTDVPSMSGVIRMQAAGQDVSQKPSDFMPAQPSPAVEPVVEQPAEPEVDYDMEMSYVNDSADTYDDPYGEPYEDDAAYDDQYEEDQYEEDQYEEPARSRFSIRGRARRNDDYDDQYDDQYGDDYDDDEYYDEEPAERPRRRSREKGSKRKFPWFGGAFSRVRLGHVDTRSGEDSSADEPEELIEVEEDVAVADEIEKIYHFRNPLYSTEIWFVAIGSDTDAHDGALAFVNEHASDLRGAMIIEVESLGLGNLSVASDEGRFRKVNASSRIKRYMRNAQSATGITPASVSLAGSDSIASIAQKAGFQAMHLFGEEDGKPALKGSVDDVLENLDEDVLDDNINFLMELLKKN